MNYVQIIGFIVTAPGSEQEIGPLFMNQAGDAYYMNKLGKMLPMGTSGNGIKKI